MINPPLETDDEDVKSNDVEAEDSEDIFGGPNPAGWGDSTDRDTADDA